MSTGRGWRRGHNVTGFADLATMRARLFGGMKLAPKHLAHSVNEVSGEVRVGVRRFASPKSATRGCRSGR